MLWQIFSFVRCDVETSGGVSPHHTTHKRAEKVNHPKKIITFKSTLLSIDAS